MCVKELRELEPCIQYQGKKQNAASGESALRCRGQVMVQTTDSEAENECCDPLCVVNTSLAFDQLKISSQAFKNLQRIGQIV